MALDVGITSGICSLWQQQTLFDYIIEVENQEIPVHKVIMATVSDYFRVMLSGPMLESSTGRVRIQGLSAMAVSKLVELVYTGNSNIVKDNALEILGPAVYLQMAKIIEACIKRLQKGLNARNCLERLSMFIKYAFEEEAEKVKKFLIPKFSAAFEHYSPESTLYEVMEVIIVCWRKSQWELFGLLKNWVNVNYETRKVHLKALMSQVRFGLMTPQQAAAIQQMDIYVDCDGLWGELVDKAVQYHNMPTHQKVLDESVQTKVRAGPSPFVFSNDNVRGTNLFLSLDENDRWRKHIYPESGFTEYVFQNLMVVNNFLIALTNADEKRGEQWCIFDPRTLTWSKMASMSRKKSMFTLVYHGEYLYALGGCGLPDVNSTDDVNSANDLEGYMFRSTDEVECYSFRDNTWSVSGNMPVAVTASGACVFENHIYCSGGAGLDLSIDLVHRLNLDSQQWESRAPMLTPKSSHRMTVMKIGNEDVIITFEEKSLNLEMYSPAADSWSKFDVPSSCIFHLFERGFNRNMPVIHGNTIFLLTLLDACLKWTLAESGERPSEVYVKGVPVPRCWGDSNFQSVLLAVPSHVFQ